MVALVFRHNILALEWVCSLALILAFVVIAADVLALSPICNHNHRNHCSRHTHRKNDRRTLQREWAWYGSTHFVHLETVDRNQAPKDCLVGSRQDCNNQAGFVDLLQAWPSEQGRKQWLQAQWGQLRSDRKDTN